MGIGLSIARTIVLAHKGRIWAENQTAAARRFISPCRWLHRREGLAGRIHVVDDDASFRTAIERRLKLAGYDVATYPSAQQLLDRLPGRERAGLHPARRADTRLERTGIAGPSQRARLDAADRVPDRACRHADHRANHQGRRRGFPHQAGEVGAVARRHRARAGAALARARRAPQAARDARAAWRHSRRANGRCSAWSCAAGSTSRSPIELGTTERTIKAHRHQVMEKMKVQSLAELVASAERLGLLA